MELNEKLKAGRVSPQAFSTLLLDQRTSRDKQQRLCLNCGARPAPRGSPSDPASWPSVCPYCKSDRLQVGLPVIHGGQEALMDMVFKPILTDDQVDFTKVKYAGLSCGNRWAKSNSLARIHAWLLVNKIGVPFVDYDEWARQPYATLNCAPTTDLAEIVGEYMLELLRSSPETEWMIKRVQQRPSYEIELYNGAVFRAKTTKNKGKNILGRGYDFISFDECAFEPYFLYIVDDVLAKRAVDKNATILFSSTPDGMGSWSYFWDKKLDAKMFGDTRQNVFLNFQGLLADLAKTDNTHMEQNVKGQFLMSGAAVLPYHVVTHAIDDTLNAQPFPVTPDGLYGIGLDIARKVDRVVLTVLDVSRRPFRVVYWWGVAGSELSSYDDIVAKAKEVHAYYNRYGGVRGFLGDTTGAGDPIMEKLELDGIAQGINFSGNKSRLVDNLVAAFGYGRVFDDQGRDTNPSYGLLRIPRAELLLQSLFGYRLADKGLPTDDFFSLAMALLSVWSYSDGDVEQSALPSAPYSLPTDT